MPNRQHHLFIGRPVCFAFGVRHQTSDLPPLTPRPSRIRHEPIKTPPFNGGALKEGTPRRHGGAGALLFVQGFALGRPQDRLDAAVLGTAFGGGVVGNRLFFATAHGFNAVRADAEAVYQRVLH